MNESPNIRTAGGLALEGGTVLSPDGLHPGSVNIEGDTIAALDGGSHGLRRFDATGLLVLPGLVDIHGDSFERQVQPRPGVDFPVDLALRESDRQMAACGYTTAYHALTLSWEPGLRGITVGRALIDGIRALRDELLCDTRVHVRWETYALDHVEELDSWLSDGDIDMLSINDHFDDIYAKADHPDKLAKYTGRAGQTTAEFRADMEALVRRGDEVAPAKWRLIGTARTLGLPIASHDEDTPGLRREHSAAGCHICEFPKNRETAAASVELGDPVVMGAPNIVRGGSHNQMIRAADLVEEGLCSVLASDYYYPTLGLAPFVLTAHHGITLADAWRLSSTNPARAAGLTDRGEVAPGQRADLAIVDACNPLTPRILATMVAGRVVFQTPEAFARFR